MKSVLKWGSITLVIIAVLGGGVFLLGKAFWGFTDKIVQNPPKEELVIVDAQQYSKDYLQDPTGKKYEGKIVEVTGVVSKVNEDDFELDGATKISIHLQKDVKFEHLKVGDVVTVRGFNTGYEEGTDELLIGKSIIVK